MADSNTIELSKLNSCISEFRKKESTLSQELTLFEIAGFPSRETVFSNVLKFFFDSRERHGFNTKVIKAFLKDIIPDAKETDLETINIRREALTDKKNRIDLVIETKSFLIGIENKVYHSLNNDLDDYADYLKKDSSKQPVMVVLNLNEDNYESDKNKFLFVSYKKFIDNLSSINEPEQTNKYYLFLKDFIQNIKNHFPAIMNEEQIKFLADHEDAIEQIKALAGKGMNYLHTRIANIFKPVNLPDQTWYRYSEVPWCIELHKEFRNKVLKIACTIEISKIYIEAQAEESHLFTKLKNWLNEKYNTELKSDNGWLSLHQFDNIYNVEDQDVTNELMNLVNWIEEFILKQTD